MNTSRYDNLPDDSTPVEKQKKKDSTRDLNGSYIVACRGEESLENSDSDGHSHVVHTPTHHKFRRPRTVYTSVAFDDSDIESTDSIPRHLSTRIHQDNSVDKSLPNPSNVSSEEFQLLCDSIADLSTLPNPANDSDGTLCRICHEGDRDEALLSPCFCSGTVGALHMSCLEQWLGASDKTKCEICEFQFSIKKKPKPVTWYLRNKSLGKERRYMIADIGCALCFTPFTIASVTGCLIGAQYFTSMDKDWQATTLILLAMSNVLIFLLWCWFTARRNYILCSTWRENFQEVKIKYNPPDKNNNTPNYSNGTTMTDRKLLETSFQPIPSKQLAKPVTRKVSYETSPKFQTEQVQFHEESLERDPTLRPGTPYHKRKRPHNVKQKSHENPFEITDITELPISVNMVIEPDEQHILNNTHLYTTRSTSTSTPTMVDTRPKRHNIFDENLCSATPIQHSHNETNPKHTLFSRLICGKPVVQDHPGMFVETPCAFFQTNMAAKTMARQGLIFQTHPLASKDNYVSPHLQSDRLCTPNCVSSTGNMNNGPANKYKCSNKIFSLRNKIDM